MHSIFYILFPWANFCKTSYKWLVPCVLQYFNFFQFIDIKQFMSYCPLCIELFIVSYTVSKFKEVICAMPSFAFHQHLAWSQVVVCTFLPWKTNLLYECVCPIFQWYQKNKTCSIQCTNFTLNWTSSYLDGVSRFHFWIV